MADISSWDWETIAAAMNYLIPILMAVLGVIVFLKSSEDPAKHKCVKKWFWPIFWTAIFIGAFGFFAQIMSTSHQKKFNTDLVQYYEDKFDAMKDTRSLAASEVNEYFQNGNWNAVENTKELDLILDFFDDLGFYSENGQMSDEVLHQEFYGSMRTYCQPAERYIKETEIDEPTVWNHVLLLFKRLTDIEATQSKTTEEHCNWPKSKLLQYVQDEIDLKNQTGKESQFNLD
ncbi:MAG: hypothetical protein ABR955_13660, partial [Verrucomicrobiota bacterium]